MASTDGGLPFSVRKGAPFPPPALDGHMNVVFSPRERRWIGYLRCPAAGPKETAIRVACYTVSSSADFESSSWSLPRPTGLNSSVAFQPDSLTTFGYAGIFLGFANTFNPSQQVGGPLPPGQSVMVLVWSPDGRTWEAVSPNESESLVPLAPSGGGWDCCSVFGAKQDLETTPEFLSGAAELPLFYSGCNGRFFGPRACGLGKATIGRHAFAGYVADGGGGTLVSAPMMADTGRLLVTGSGAIRVGVMYDGALSAAASTIVNGTEVEVRWGANGTLSKWKGSAVVLVFELEAGSALYAFHL